MYLKPAYANFMYLMKLKTAILIQNHIFTLFIDHL